MDYNHLFVCLMGMGTVFFGLICLVALSTLMSAVLRSVGKQPAVSAPPVPAPTVPAAGAVITPELIAAISAAVAEDLGTDVTGIRILSVKPL